MVERATPLVKALRSIDMMERILLLR